MFLAKLPRCCFCAEIKVLGMERNFARIFYIFQKVPPWIFRTFRVLLFLHKNNTMAILLKTALVRVSSIQIMHVRVQNKGKSVWKSIYDGDISTASQYIPCWSSSCFLAWPSSSSARSSLCFSPETSAVCEVATSNDACLFT